mgnify:FL=1|jgi:hypothetical protein
MTKALVTVATSVKISGLQYLYFYMDRMQLYNYHQVQYKGIFKDVLDYIDYSKQQFWLIFN